MEYNVHQQLVSEFMQKQGFPLDVDIRTVDNDQSVRDALDHVSSSMYCMSRLLERIVEMGCDDPRIARAQLHVEETAELVESLATRNRKELFDAVCDVQFITIGTALTFSLPIEEGHKEVCRSNLTKKRRDPNDPRCRDKGPDYSPPDLDSVLDPTMCKACGECVDCSH